MHRDHELHVRRRGRNMGLLLVLLSFVAIIFGLTLVKVENGGLSQAFNHVLRPEMLPVEPGTAMAPATSATTVPADAPGSAGGVAAPAAPIGEVTE